MAEDTGDKKTNKSIKPASIARIFELARKHCTAAEWRDWLCVPFEFAAFEGDEELVLELGMAGARGDPFEAAIRGGQYDFLDLHMETPRDGNLQLAVELGHESIVSLILDRGANTEAESFEHDTKVYLTPILHAAKEGNAGIVGLLLDAGASVHRRLQKDQVGEWTDTYAMVETESALDLAAIRGHVDVIREIIQREPSCVNSDVSPSTKFTALHYAAKHSQLGAIDALVEAGADLEAQNGVQHGTALHAAVESPDCAATLLALLRHGAHVDSTRDGIVTPFSVAVKAANMVAADVLLSAGADLREPLLAASAEPCSVEKIIYLLERGADVNTRRASDGNTPLHVATEARLESNVVALLKAGGDEMAVNDEGKIPLDVVGSGYRRDTPFGLRIHQSSADDIRNLLVNAPRDRADRAWSRRGFFVLCRAFPERVRLDLASSQDFRVNDACSAASSASDDLPISRANKKRAATAEERGGEGGKLGGALVEESATAFRAAMGRLMGLEADVVFRTIMEFV